MHTWKVHLHIQSYLPGVIYQVSWIFTSKYYFTAYLRMFSGGELWATVQMRKLVICPTCEKLRDRQRPKGCINFVLTLVGLMPSAANQTIDQLPDRAVLIFSQISTSLARFLFLIIPHFFMCFGDYSPCVRKLWIVGSLTRPACNDSGDALKQRLSGGIYLDTRGQV